MNNATYNSIALNGFLAFAPPPAPTAPTWTPFPMTAPASAAPLYCTDEDVAARAPQDFLALCPRWQVLGRGTDGVVSGWVLTSASVDFAAAGVGFGFVVALSRPLASFKFPELFAVDSASGGALVLRRIDLPLNAGQPPPAVASGVEFEVRSFLPQIDGASFDAKHFFRINELLPGRQTANLYDPRELQQYTVLSVLRRMYISADKEKAGDYDLKLNLVTQELSDLVARLNVHWGTAADADVPDSVFSSRMRR